MSPYRHQAIPFGAKVVPALSLVPIQYLVAESPEDWERIRKAGGVVKLFDDLEAYYIDTIKIEETRNAKRARRFLKKNCIEHNDKTLCPLMPNLDFSLKASLMGYSTFIVSEYFMERDPDGNTNIIEMPAPGLYMVMHVDPRGAAVITPLDAWIIYHTYTPLFSHSYRGPILVAYTDVCEFMKRMVLEKKCGLHMTAHYVLREICGVSDDELAMKQNGDTYYHQ